MYFRSCITWIVLSLLGAVWASQTSAAAPSRGRVLKQSAPPPSLPAPPQPVLSLPSVKQQSAPTAIRIAVKKIVVEGNHLLPSSRLEALLQPAIGHTVTLGRLRELAAKITDAYHARGFPLAYAYIPAQTVRGGVVKMAAVEPHYDHIRIQGPARLKHSQARRVLGLQADEPIAQGPLERGLLLLQREPGVRVAATLAPGSRPATSTLKVGLRNRPLVSGSVRTDNYGSQYTGRTRGELELSLNDPLGYGSQVSINGQTTEAGLLHAGGGTLVSPDLWHGLRAGVYGSRTVYRLGGRFAALGQRGHANQGGFYFSYPVILQPGRLLTTRFDLLRSNFEQRITRVGVDERSHTTVGQLSLDGAYADDGGGVSSVGLSLRRGGFTRTARPRANWMPSARARAARSGSASCSWAAPSRCPRSCACGLRCAGNGRRQTSTARKSFIWAGRTGS